jgi:Replication initiation factor
MNHDLAKAPASNTGATFSPPPARPAEKPRFDWMQATVTDDAKLLRDRLADDLGADVSDARGLNGYAASYVLKRRAETLARVLYGGRNGRPHVIATGAATDDVVPVLRAAYPDSHFVTRMDSASDFDLEGGYDQVLPALLARAEKSRMQSQQIESVKGGYRSRTLYLGAPASRVRVRMYEKGMMERQNGDQGAPEGWFRIEAQIRPDGREARAEAASLGAAAAWGSSPMLRGIANEILGLNVDPVKVQQKRKPDYERALHFMMKQYGATLETAVFNEGSWAAVGRLLGIVVADD